jgi:hypothetical protein
MWTNKVDPEATSSRAYCAILASLITLLSYTAHNFCLQSLDCHLKTKNLDICQLYSHFNKCCPKKSIPCLPFLLELTVIFCFRRSPFSYEISFAHIPDLLDSGVSESFFIEGDNMIMSGSWTLSKSLLSWIPSTMSLFFESFQLLA